MFELVQVGSNTYYIDCPAKIGVYKISDNEVYLIDSGSDKDAGRKLRKILDEKGWHLKAIINTHSNADHIGGNQYLQRQTGCKIFAKGIETAFTKFPLLEPSFLYGGYPCKALRHKFLMAAESDALDLPHVDFPKELDVIDLPGHFFDMIGLRTPDDVVFLADCLSSEEILNKYRIPFIYDVAGYLDTLAKVENMEATFFVPSHTEATSSIKELAKFNKNKVSAIAEDLVSWCTKPLTFEVILKKAFDEYGLTMNFEQYVLVGSTIRSYLSWLSDTGRITASFGNNELVWEKAN